MPWAAAAAVPPPISVSEVATGWAADPLPLLLTLLAGWGYAVGVSRLARRGRRWSAARSASFAGGLVVVLLATQSGLARYDTVLFSAHATQHVLLGMLGPLLLVLGAPVLLALQASARPTQLRLIAVLHHPVVRFLTHPVTAWLLFGTSMFALYLTGLYELSLRNGWVHAWVHVHLLVVGSLFAEAVLGVDPGWAAGRGGRNLAYPLRLLLVVLLVPFHAVLGLALLSAGEPVAAAWYSGLGRSWGASPLSDQRTGAAIMWAVGDLVGLLLIGVVVWQWMRADEREAARLDAADDARRARAAAPAGPGPNPPR